MLTSLFTIRLHLFVQTLRLIQQLKNSKSKKQKQSKKYLKKIKNNVNELKYRKLSKSKQLLWLLFLSLKFGLFLLLPSLSNYFLLLLFLFDDVIKIYYFVYACNQITFNKNLSKPINLTVQILLHNIRLKYINSIFQNFNFFKLKVEKF